MPGNDRDSFQNKDSYTLLKSAPDLLKEDPWPVPIASWESNYLLCPIHRIYAKLSYLLDLATYLMDRY